MPLLVLVLSLCYGGSRAAFVVDHGMSCLVPSASVRLNPCTRSDQRRLSPPLPHLTSSLFSTASKTDSDTWRTLSRKEIALQLMEENSMPLANDDDHLYESGDANHPTNGYDEEQRTPLESEFVNMMFTFLTYSERDIQSLTSTSTRYIHRQLYARHGMHAPKPKRPRNRTKEDGIRYRALYSGVQAASLEPEVLRSFTVLFEDFLPIRLAGRRIHAHLKNVMEEVRDEREGEIAAAREVCPRWDQGADAGEDYIQNARRVWDVIMDEALLLDNSLESGVENEQCQEGGVVSLSQLIRLGIVQVIVEEDIVKDVKELECMVGQVALHENAEMERHLNLDEECSLGQVQEGGTHSGITFPMFMKILYQCTMGKKTIQDHSPMDMLQTLERKVMDEHVGDINDQGTSTMLAAKATHNGSSNACKKRQRHSESFDGYVSKFQLWERKFLGNGDAKIEPPQSRRLEILRGCFFGARNAKVVAALKIVYMDYSALRLAGDLIFKLMSKIAA
mmetsp:Transcript_26572/g.56526  ORF Transcript_26572/g.56526 Transcript_26572/m.56526 type:complete len:506 (+) Transcript_26572:73-1590(+)